MRNVSNLIKFKKKLTQLKIGRLMIKVYHFIIAVPIVKFYSYSYRFIKRKIKNVNFYSTDDTFDMLINKKKSLCRFGDGEISWIFQDSKGYFGQENSKELSSKLYDIITNDNDDILIGIPDFFGPMEHYSKKRIESRNAHLARYYKRWMELIKDDRVYVDALITRVYNGRIKDDIPYIFNKWKSVWNGKNVVIIEGSKTRFGVGNDLLHNAKSVKRIIAPAENAFEKYEEILNASLQCISNDTLFLISLGPTATILAYDIGNNGSQAIDIGHLDIEYEWYLSRAKKKEPIPGKYVNEAGGSSNFEISEKYLDYYRKEIIEKI